MRMKKLAHLKILGKMAALAGIFFALFFCFFALTPQKAYADSTSVLKTLNDDKTTYQNLIQSYSKDIQALNDKMAGSFYGLSTQYTKTSDQLKLQSDQSTLALYSKHLAEIQNSIDQLAAHPENADAILAARNASEKSLTDSTNKGIDNVYQKSIDEANTCSFIPMRPIPCLVAAATWVGDQVLTLAGFILWVAGMCFQIALWLTLSIKSLVNSNQGIRIAWAALRDLSNIVFIFAMLYMSIETILDRPNSYKKLLKPLIIAAIFINFSFFISGIIPKTNIYIK